MTRPRILIVLPAMIALLGGCVTTAPAPGGGESVEEGVASYYADSFEGRRTASGEEFRQSELTAAHKTLPFGSLVLVTRVETGQSVAVRVNDRLPSRSSRVIDLARAAAERIGMIRAGTVRVRLQVQRLGP